MGKIADKIRIVARQKGIKLEYIYNAIGMSNAGFYKMLRNESYKPEVIEQIATILDVSVEELLSLKVKVSKASPLIYKNPELLQLFRMDFENYLNEIDYNNIPHKTLLQKLSEYPMLIETRLRQYEIHRVLPKEDN